MGTITLFYINHIVLYHMAIHKFFNNSRISVVCPVTDGVQRNPNLMWDSTTPEKVPEHSAAAMHTQHLPARHNLITQNQNWLWNSVNCRAFLRNITELLGHQSMPDCVFADRRVVYCDNVSAVKSNLECKHGCRKRRKLKARTSKMLFNDKIINKGEKGNDEEGVK